ncbi:MAG TPA: GlsB/YeaQ/YmgE family stress response membrane protein [Acidimicrobiales bacterium]
MSVFGWIIMGLLAGGVARIIIPSRGQGCLYTMVIGVLGAMIGGALATAAGVGDGINGFNFGTFVIAFLGACLLLLILYALGGRSATPH